MNVINCIAKIIALIGALNWGAIGFFDYNFVTAIFSNLETAHIIYDIVGVAAVWVLVICAMSCTCRK